jgi:hypothetical protein
MSWFFGFFNKNNNDCKNIIALDESSFLEKDRFVKNLSVHQKLFFSQDNNVDLLDSAWSIDSKLTLNVIFAKRKLSENMMNSFIESMMWLYNIHTDKFLDILHHIPDVCFWTDIIILNRKIKDTIVTNKIAYIFAEHLQKDILSDNYVSACCNYIPFQTRKYSKLQSLIMNEMKVNINEYRRIIMALKERYSLNKKEIYKTNTYINPITLICKYVKSKSISDTYEELFSRVISDYMNCHIVENTTLIIDPSVNFNTITLRLVTLLNIMYNMTSNNQLLNMNINNNKTFKENISNQAINHIKEDEYIQFLSCRNVKNKNILFISSSSISNDSWILKENPENIINVIINKNNTLDDTNISLDTIKNTNSHFELKEYTLGNGTNVIDICTSPHIFIIILLKIKDFTIDSIIKSLTDDVNHIV